jgi:predicted nucleic acid-binding protein
LYSTVFIPEGVAQELNAGHEQGVPLPDLETLDWIRLRSAPSLQILPQFIGLGRGESEVLAMGSEAASKILLLDDRLARQVARHLKLRFTGTLGVLLRAKKEGHLRQVSSILHRLQEQGFWVDATTRSAVLRLANEI